MKQRKNLPLPALLTAAGVCIGLVCRLFVFDILKVSGDSMYPACTDGSYICVNKLAYGLGNPFSGRLLLKWAEPKENDVVIYIYDNKTVVKRCLGTPGTPLVFSADLKYGTLVHTMKTPAASIPLSPEQYRMIRSSPSVPNERILAVGDNYEKSIDSRNYGFVSTYCMLGKVLCK